MPSFNSVYRKMLSETDMPLLSAASTPGEDQEAMDAFRQGLRLRNNVKDATFWNELKQLSVNKRNGLAKLLQVSPVVIGRWAAIIDNYMHRANALDAHEDGVQKPQVLPTGIPTPAVAIRGNHGDSNVPQTQHPI